MRFTIRCAVCSSCLHLAHPSRLCRGAVLASSPGGGCGFRSLVKVSQASIRTYRYVPICVYVYKQYSGPAGRPLSLRDQVRWFECRMAFFFVVYTIFTFFFFIGTMYFATSTKICTMVMISSEQSRSQFYMRTECCYCCCCCCCCCSVLLYCCVVAAAAAAAMLLLPTAVRRRVPDGQNLLLLH